MIVVVVIIVVLLVGCGYTGWSFRRVPADHVGLVLCRIGPSDTQFRMVTPGNAAGLQATVLMPNKLCWLPRGLYSVTYVPKTVVPRDQIGLVIALEGANRPAERKLGIGVDCDNFQDGARFLRAGGQQGPQVATLPGGQAYYINTRLFEVRFVPLVYVPAGGIGLVVALDGEPLPPGARFGRHVDCNAFRDGMAFVAGHGQIGRQLEVLTGGVAYAINPWLFRVITDDNVGAFGEEGLTRERLRAVAIPAGSVGVVVTLDGRSPGRDPDDQIGPVIPGHSHFQQPWIFLRNGGFRGVQQETLGGGTILALNPWFLLVTIVPTRLLILEWNRKRHAGERAYDAHLDPIVVTVQGHRLRVDMSQVLRIPEASAPRLISEFGGIDRFTIGGLYEDPRPVQRFVEKVLGGVVESFFSEIAAASTVESFLSRYSEARTDLQVQVRQALADRGVVADQTTLGQFEVEDRKLNEEYQATASEQLRHRMLETQLANAKIEDEIDKVKVRPLVRRAALELEAELRVEIEMLGRGNATMIQMIRELTRMNVPQVITAGNVSELVDAMPISTVQQLLDQLHQLRSAMGIGDQHTIEIPVMRVEAPAHAVTSDLETRLWNRIQALGPGTDAVLDTIAEYSGTRPDGPITRDEVANINRALSPSNLEQLLESLRSR